MIREIELVKTFHGREKESPLGFMCSPVWVYEVTAPQRCAVLDLGERAVRGVVFPTVSPGRVTLRRARVRTVPPKTARPGRQFVPRIATAERVDRDALLEFLRPRHRTVLMTTRADGRPQLSPVTCGVDESGRIVVSTYPNRAKTRNARREPRVSLCVLSDEWNDAWVQLDGTAEVLDMPDALDGLVEYFRCISGEHPDWDEYREAMRRQGKSLLRITIDDWGPIATGGFPPELADD